MEPNVPGRERRQSAAEAKRQEMHRIRQHGACQVVGGAAH